MTSLRIATRKSELALCQAELVKQAILKHFSRLKIIFIPLSTSGDQLLHHPLSAIGGKGLFIKEIEEALLENRADIAVHSMKDMPAQMTPSLKIAAYLEREDPRDVLISPHYKNFLALPPHSKIGTASLRRQSMIKYIRQDLCVETLRGNVNTRLAKLDSHHYEAIILAAAGLKRLGLTHRIQQYFAVTESLPAIGQGIIGIQCRENDEKIRSLLLPLDHFPTRVCMETERALNTALGGNCHSPIGGYAVLKEKILTLSGCVYSLDGKICLKSKASGGHTMEAVQHLSQQVSENLLNQGAREILQNIK